MNQLSFAISGESEQNAKELAYFTAAVPPLEGEFIYSYSKSDYPELCVGDVLEVPLGRRQALAFITSIDSAKEHATQADVKARGVKIKQIPGDSRVNHAFNQEHLAFYQWIGKYYAEPLSKILDLAIPSPSPDKPERLYKLTPLAAEVGAAPVRNGSVQQKVLMHLSTNPDSATAKALQESCGASAAVLRTLEKKGLIETFESCHTGAQSPNTSVDVKPDFTLNSDQHTAVDAIKPYLQSQTFHTSLLQGVTGSGKTEVYLSLIMDALRQGRSSLVIVPEIALTPQLTERFTSRLRQPVAVLHSSLKPKERWKHWTDLASGRVKVAIGARSALFAPICNLGLIVVDEEHDSSFKQGEGIRYHARDLALVRGKLSSCPVVLGSATPSLETYHHAVSGKYLHLRLTQRYHDAAATHFTIIDLNAIKPWEMKSKSISPQFYSSLNKALTSGGQAFVLYNKRGFASYLQCSACEYVVGCPHCSVTLTFHRNTNTLLCHQCNFSMVPPLVCASCGAQPDIDKPDELLFAQRGSGTERVHEEIRALFPTARVATLDRDSASSVSDFVDILGRVKNREIDILVGTQMIAKGHDLPGVTFVGIVDCDVGLHIPDFRAAERSFQLLTQVAGRAGRRTERGTVVLQTRVPTHNSLQMTATSNYADFAAHELKMRQALGYPPFRKILRVIISSADKSQALTHAAEVARSARALIESSKIELLGPAPAPIEKIRTLWRYHIIFKSSSAAELQHVMKQLKKIHSSSAEIRLAYDLDPHDML